MKKLTVLICCVAFWTIIPNFTSGASLQPENSADDTIQIWSSPELLNLTNTLVRSYSSSHPEVKMNVKSFPSHISQSELLKSGSVGFISDEAYSSENDLFTWRMVVARDIVVPIMNTNNPFKSEILKKGVSSKSFANVYSMSGEKNWGMLLQNNFNTSLKFYQLDNEVDHYNLAEFLERKETEPTNIQALDSDQLISEIQKDPLAIGFCKLSKILDSNGTDFTAGIVPIPIDVNGNGKIDFLEDIYDNPTDLARGIWIGKYPKQLYSSILAVSGMQPSGDVEKDFLDWVVNEGQINIPLLGYSELIPSEKLSKMESIEYTPVNIAESQSNSYLTISIIFTIIMVLAVVLFLFTMNIVSRTTKIIEEPFESIPYKVFNENTINAPRGLFFNKTHTWAFMEKNGLIRLGIDDFLQHVVGPISKVKLRKVGSRIEKGETLVSIIQDGKKLDIQSPISGIIEENNEKLSNEASLINADPYNAGWVLMVQPENWQNESKAFVMGEAFKTLLTKEFSRLKDFIAFIIKDSENEKYPLVLQDGGEMFDNPLEQLGPEAWEEFQTKFLNQMN